MYKVKEVSEITGISIRMLHHYDKIGLLKPYTITDAGYRLYNDDNLDRLQQILIFKELDFELKEIKEILDNPNFDRLNSLKEHKELIIKRKNRLDNIILSIDKSITSIEGGIKMSKKEIFNPFSMEAIEKHEKEYKKETEEKYGNSDAYKESQQKTSKYTKSDWEDIMMDASNIYEDLASMMEKNPDDEQVQECIERWRVWITKNFYNCTPEIFAGLADMYIYDERFTKNIDKYGDGLAQFLSDAMKIYCDKLMNK